MHGTGGHLPWLHLTDPELVEEAKTQCLASLPSGSGSVTTDGTTYTITVTWDDDRDGVADTCPGQPGCFVFQLQP